MTINWYSVQEFSRLFSYEPIREIQGDWMSYAVSLGDGLRFWMTLDVFLIAALLVAVVFGLRPRFVALLGLIPVGAPIAMVFGFYLGADYRGFDMATVLSHAVQRLVC